MKYITKPIALLFTVLHISTFSLLASDEKPSLFIQCNNGCNINYLKEKVNFIDYVDDRFNSDIFISITAQRTANGADEVQLIVNHQDDSTITIDTIQYTVDSNASNISKNNMFVKNIKRAVLPSLLKSDMVDFINYTLDNDRRESLIQRFANKDPWNNWTFNLAGNLNMSGEASSKHVNYSLRVASAHILESHKFQSSLYFSKNNSIYELSDDETVHNDQKRYYSFTEYVKSVNPHWSIGLRSFIGSSTFKNLDVEANIKPAIEYNLFPYSENSTRRFSILYSVGPEFNNYESITIFNKEKEIIGQHSVDLEFRQNRNWGNLAVFAEFDQYLHQPELYSLTFHPKVELNLVKGLSLKLGGSLSYIGDRINIPGQDLSETDILLNLVQRDTSYQYHSYTGLNFRFGSKTNNVVNSRF